MGVSKNFNVWSDRELWESIASGDQLAFSHLYEKSANALFGYGHKFCNDKRLIEDVIQDVFVILWEKRQQLTINRSIKFYLFRIFRREMMHRLQGTKYIRQGLDNFSEESSWEVSIQELLIQRQMSIDSDRHVRESLKVLTKRQREAIYLRYIEGLSYEEISSLMDVKVPYLYNVVLKGLKSLKEYFVTNGIVNIPSLILLLLFWKRD
ncbi:sigma-70 family RNA polymerase sigma factor [Echinicola soli]|uniref:Sigma-70 family RNA polymerase sigma factor n=1 Tax=Echinicola soli TaxID=2591634 RepID=A0A514CIG1_9BACT|nr:sigma-70 family RNA polymerase sigma factor [Echinicola soli]QDH79617.1 sigma-70 family RNA polymerase sigma factor [Echinicola soli]